jgi:hypothetical protein
LYANINKKKKKKKKKKHIVYEVQVS